MPGLRPRARHPHGHRVPRRRARARWPPGSSACTSACAPTCARPPPRAAASSRRSRSRCAAGRSPGFLVVALSLLGVWGIFAAYGGLVSAESVHDAPFLIVGFGFGASLRRPVRAAGRRHLHQGRRRRLGPRRQGREGHPRGRPPQRGRGRGPRGRQRRRLRRPRRGPVRVHRRREHRRDDPGRRACSPSPRPTAGPTPRPGSSSRSSSARFGLLATIVAMFFIRGREDEDPMNILNRGYWVTTLLSVVGARVRHQPDDADQRRRRGQRPAGVGLLLRVRRRRPRDERRVRLHHAVLHGGLVPPGARDRRGVQDRPGDEHHLGHGGRLRDHARHGAGRSASRCSPATGWAARPASPTPRAPTSAASSAPRSRRWACS